MSESEGDDGELPGLDGDILSNLVDLPATDRTTRPDRTYDKLEESHISTTQCSDGDCEAVATREFRRPDEESWTTFCTDHRPPMPRGEMRLLPAGIEVAIREVADAWRERADDLRAAMESDSYDRDEVKEQVNEQTEAMFRSTANELEARLDAIFNASGDDS